MHNHQVPRPRVVDTQIDRDESKARLDVGTLTRPSHAALDPDDRHLGIILERLQQEEGGVKRLID